MVLDFGNSLFSQRDVRETATSLLSVTDVLAPVGSILSWLKNLTGTPGLPSGWVECNGQTISDTASVYNGTAIPDLNGGNRFLRGNSTSGTTGGAATRDLSHTHSVSGSTTTNGPHEHSFSDETGPGQTGAGDDLDTIRRIIDIGGHHDHYVSGGTTSGGSSTQNIEPQYYNIVFIMRIK